MYTANPVILKEIVKGENQNLLTRYVVVKYIKR
jgi:hypothetical protein